MTIRDGYVANKFGIDIENYIEKITQPGQILVIAGDFNCGGVDWDSHYYKNVEHLFIY